MRTDLIIVVYWDYLDRDFRCVNVISLCSMKMTTLTTATVPQGMDGKTIGWLPLMDSNSGIETKKEDNESDNGIQKKAQETASIERNTWPFDSNKPFSWVLEVG